jgi:hypothetical protein
MLAHGALQVQYLEVGLKPTRQVYNVLVTYRNRRPFGSKFLEFWQQSDIFGFASSYF